MLLVLIFQNCEYASQLNIINTKKPMAQSIGGNGGGYDGKILVYNHIVPNFKCEGREAPQSTIKIYNNELVELTENRNDKCGSHIQTLDNFDQSNYNLELLGFRERIYEFEKENWSLNTQNYKEAWCKPEIDSSEKFDISIEFRNDTGTAYYQFYYPDEQYKPYVSNYYLVHTRNISKSSFEYKGKGFQLTIDRSQPAPLAWWFFPAKYEGIIDGINKKVNLNCRIATGKLLGVVQKKYPNNGQWSDHVKNSEPYDSCLGAEQKLSECIHSGEKLRVATSEPNCKPLVIEDKLKVFDWKCEDNTGEAIFETTGLKQSKGLQDLIEPFEWKSNSIKIYKLPVNDENINVNFFSTYLKTDDEIIYESISEKWWDNSVKELPNSKLSKVEIKNDSSKTVYILNESYTSQGILIDKSDGISIVSLGLNKLFAPNPIPCLDNSCSNFWDSPSVILSKNSKFQWLELEIDGMSIEGGALINLLQTNWINIRNSHLHHSGVILGTPGYGLFMYKAENTIVSDSEFNNNRYGIYSAGYSNQTLLKNLNLHDHSLNAVDFEVSDRGVVMQNINIQKTDFTALKMRAVVDLNISALTSKLNSTGLHLDLDFSENNLIFKSDLSDNNVGLNIDRIINSIFADLKVLNSTNYAVGVQGSLLGQSNLQYLGEFNISGLINNCNILSNQVEPIIPNDLCLTGRINNLQPSFSNKEGAQLCEALQNNFNAPVGREPFLRNALEIIGDNVGNENGICEPLEDCFFSPEVGSDLKSFSLTQIPICKIAQGQFKNTQIRLKIY